MRRMFWASLLTALGLVAATAGAAADCLSDVRGFDQELADSGYWMGGSEDGVAGGNDAPNSDGFRSLRPSHELRMLVASAVILARQHHDKRCADVLASAREIYHQKSKDKVNNRPPVVTVEDWRRAEVASAVAVTDNYPFYRSDELIGTEVRDPRCALLGTVADVIQVRRTGKIAYLIIDRSGVFGFGDKRVAVPWAGFRITATASLLVLDTTQSALDNAPTGYNRYSKTEAAADLQTQKIDAYWTAH